MSAVEGAEVFEGGDRLYSLTHLDGFLEMVHAPRRVRPADYSVAELAAMPRQSLLRHNDDREVWHANLGPYKSGQVDELHGHITEIVAANRQDGNRLKSGAVLDAYPGLGKSTGILEYAKRYWLDQVEMHGETTPSGDRRVPIIYVGLTGNTQIRGLNELICRFYMLPTSGNADQLAARAMAASTAMATKVFIVEDVHFLDIGRVDSKAMTNHLKFLSNAFAVTLLYTSVGMMAKARSLMTEGQTLEKILYAQFARRTTPLGLAPFNVDAEAGRLQWRKLLLGIEQDLVLANKYEGMLADDLSDYFFARSTGHFASLMTLVIRGCGRAMRTGAEQLTVELMDHVKNDAASEAARKELQDSFEAGLSSSRPGRQLRKGGR